MGLIAANGINIHYDEAGVGSPLVLIHGLSDNSSVWANIIPKMSTQYHIIALDLRGHGESEKPNMRYTIQLFSEDVLCCLQKLRIPNAHILGLSLGAAVAQQLTLDHPERIRSLILLSPFSHANSQLRNHLELLRERLSSGGMPAFLDAVIKLVVSPEFISANANEITEMKMECSRINSPTAITHAIDACINFNVKNRISKISKPTLIISGRQDILSPIHLAEQIHLSIKNSKWEIMESVGHNLLIPEKIPTLAGIILEFMQHQ